MKINKLLLFLICLMVNSFTISKLQCAAAAAGAGAGSSAKEEADTKSDNDDFIVSFDKSMQFYLDFSSKNPERWPVLSFGMKSGSFWNWKPTDKWIVFEKIDTKDNNISFKFKINNKINDKEEAINKILLGGKQNNIEVKPGYRYYFFDFLDSENNELTISSVGNGGIFINLGIDGVGVDGIGAMDVLFIDHKFDLFPKFSQASPIAK